MTTSEKERILVKLQELTNIIQGISCYEATLFDQVTPTISTTDIPSLEFIPEEEQPKPRRQRKRYNDGTMTASVIASHLSKELGRRITRESVINVGKKIKAKPTYCASQHDSRYSSNEVNTIMDLYRTFNI